MKHENWYSCGIGAALAFLISLGAVGSMVTGFGLNLESMAPVVLTCAFFAAVSALCFCFKWGGTALLCLLALISGFLWHRGEPAEQLLALLYQISVRYDSAYGWGVLRLMDGDLGAYALDWPMKIIGCLVAIAVSYTVCRRKSALLGVIAGLLPLFFCLVVTDTVPDSFYLYILMLGIALLLLTGTVRREDVRQGNRLAAMVLLPTALALGILFLAVPRESYVNQSKEIQEKMVAFVEGIPEMVEDIPEAAENVTEQIAQNFTGSSSREVSLDTLGRRVTYRYPVMDVTVRKDGTLYLREQDYDSYSGTGWTSTRNRSETFSGTGEVAGDVIISTRGKKDVLYLPYYPGGETTLTGGMMLNDQGLKEYVVDWRNLPSDWKQTVEEKSEPIIYESGPQTLVGVGPAANPKDQWRYLMLPEDTKTRAKQIVESLLTNEYSATAKADTIAAYVRNSALYDLDTGRMPRDEEDFALWFLEDSETGYCVHFATATVVLLRAAGIEARYVTGYMVQAKAGETVTVTEEEAHAWAEYYEPVLGIWIPLESTPADLNGEEVPEEETSDTEARPETTVPEETELETLPEAPEETTAESTESTSAIGGSQDPGEEPVDVSWLGDAFRIVVFLVLAVMLLEGQRQTRLRLRRQRQRRGKPNARALACWQELALIAKLRKEPAPWDAEQLAQKAKFSQHTLTAEELAVLEDQLRACRRMLREEKWYLQLICKYVLALY